MKRALSEWEYIDFVNDVESCLFTAVVYRDNEAWQERVMSGQMVGVRDKLADMSVEKTSIRDKSGKKSVEIIESRDNTGEMSVENTESLDKSAAESDEEAVSLGKLPLKLGRKAKTMQKVLELIAGDDKITTSAMAERIGVAEKTIERNIKSLKEAGRIESVGANKNGSWRIINN